MKNLNLRISLAAFPLLAAAAILAPHAAQAHCGGMDGPVVKAAQKKLAETNINLVLIWVQKHDETQIKQAFEKTHAVRKLNPEARELADMYFFETLVRIHRAGEGAPFTGLKPAGTELTEKFAEVDRAVGLDVVAWLEMFAKGLATSVQTPLPSAARPGGCGCGCGS